MKQIPERSQVVMLIVLVAGLGLINPALLSLGSWSVLFRAISGSGFVAAGMAICAVNGMLDLSAGAIASLASIIYSMSVIHWDIPWWGALVGTVGICSLLGMLNYWAILKTGIPALFVSIGAMYIYRAVANSLADGGAVYFLPDWRLALTTQQFLGVNVAFWILVPILVVLGLALKYSVWGLQIRACGSDRRTAYWTEVDVEKVSYHCFAIMGFLAALGGILTAMRLQAGHPTIGMNWEFRGLVACALGGISLFGHDGSYLGLALGLVLAQVIANGVVMIGLQAHLQPAFLGIVLVAAVSYDIWQKEKDWEVK
jgi:ribose transport system permease protein